MHGVSLALCFLDTILRRVPLEFECIVLYFIPFFITFLFIQCTCSFCSGYSYCRQAFYTRFVTKFVARSLKVVQFWFVLNWSEIIVAISFENKSKVITTTTSLFHLFITFN